MTKKDYIALAAVLHSQRVPNASNAERRTLWNKCCDNHAYALAELLAQDNAAFDRARFLSACGVQ